MINNDCFSEFRFINTIPISKRITTIEDSVVRNLDSLWMWQVKISKVIYQRWLPNRNCLSMKSWMVQFMWRMYLKIFSSYTLFRIMTKYVCWRKLLEGIWTLQLPVPYIHICVAEEFILKEFVEKSIVAYSVFDAKQYHYTSVTVQRISTAFYFEG